MLRTLLHILIVFTLLCISAPGSMAGGKDILRVGYHNFPPLQFKDGKGQAAGINIELVKQVADRLDMTPEFHFYPFKRLLSMLEHGELDVMTGVLKRPEREYFLHFISPPYKTRSNKAFFVLQGREHTIRRHEDLHFLRVGTTLGSRYYPQFEKDPHIHKEVVPAPELSMKMLLAGRIDTFIVTECVGEYRIRLTGNAGKISKSEFVYSNPQNVYMVLSKYSSKAARLKDFEEAMEELVEQDCFDKSKERFFSSLGHPPN